MGKKGKGGGDTGLGQSIIRDRFRGRRAVTGRTDRGFVRAFALGRSTAGGLGPKPHAVGGHGVATRIGPHGRAERRLRLGPPGRRFHHRAGAEAALLLR